MISCRKSSKKYALLQPQTHATDRVTYKNKNLLMVIKKQQLPWIDP